MADARSQQKKLDTQRAAGQLELQKEVDGLRESLVQQAKVRRDWCLGFVLVSKKRRVADEARFIDSSDPSVPVDTPRV